MDNVKEKLLNALKEHKELWEWIRRLDDGVGTYEEVSRIAELTGDEVVKGLAPYSEEYLTEYMVAAHSIIADAGVVAQQNLNDAAKIGLKPMTTKYPRSKVRQLAEKVAQTAPETVPVVLKNAVPTLTMSMVDDIVEYNADSRYEAYRLVLRPRRNVRVRHRTETGLRSARRVQVYGGIFPRQKRKRAHYGSLKG